MHETSIRDLCRKYASGTPIAQLAKEYGRSVNTIKGLLKTHIGNNDKYRTSTDIRRPLKLAQPDEKWKALRLATKTAYEISNYGRIRNMSAGTILNYRIVFGYFSFEYTDQELGQKKTKLVHVLTARHWLPRFDSTLNTVHLDHDNFNNHYRNLQQVTAKQRAARVTQGGKSKNFKLTEAVVKKIKSSGESPALLAERFGVSTMQVLRVQRGDSWGHVLPHKTRPKQPTPATPPKTVARIKALLAAGKAGKAIATKLGVTETAVSRIKRGKTYKEKK